jgi:hypothetical protein
MSSMLDQAIIDATALREAAIKSAEQAVVEKYSTDIKEAVEKLMEENDFEEDKSVDEQIVEADEKGNGYAFVENTELSDLKQDDLVEIDVKSLFEEVQQEQTEESLTEEFEVTEELIEQLIEEVMEEEKKPGKVEDKPCKKEGDYDCDGDVDMDDVDIAVKRHTDKIAKGETNEGHCQDHARKEGKKDFGFVTEDELEETLEEESSMNKCPKGYKAMKSTDGKIVCVVPVDDARSKGKMEEEINFDFEPVVVGQTTGFGATRAQQAEQAMLMDVMLAVEEQNANLETKNESLIKTNSDLNETNQKLKETVKNIAEKFEEIKLMNSKLFYTNQTLMDDSLNERQKGNLVESINNAQTSEQAKIVYETLKSTVGNATTSKQPESLSEAVGKRSSTSLLLKAQKSDDKPKVNESNILADRMQALAGIKYHKED